MVKLKHQITGSFIIIISIELCTIDLVQNLVCITNSSSAMNPPQEITE